MIAASEKTNEAALFLCVDTNSQKLKFDRKFVIGHGLRVLKLTASQGWTDGINLFFASWYKSTQSKSWLKIFQVGMVKNGCGQYGDGIRKLTVSEE